MVVKKQLRKISKKIMILGLATSIIFTSCFSTKKINAHATGIAVTLSAYTLYEICLYVGTLAISALGVGYVYENRDEIAEFGKTIIDSMSDIPEQGWFFGSAQQDVNTVYGREALVQAQMAAWAFIVTGGQSPKNDNNNDDDDGDDDGNDGGNGENQEPLSDYDKRSQELGFINFFLTSAGVQLFGNAFQSVYQKWVDKEEDNILDDKFGEVDAVYFDGYQFDNAGNYYGYFEYYHSGDLKHYEVVCSGPLLAYVIDLGDEINLGFVKTKNGKIISGSEHGTVLAKQYVGGIKTNLPLIRPTDATPINEFIKDGTINGVSNVRQSYQIPDWMNDEAYWKSTFEDIATSLRSLEDLVDLTQELSDYALNYKPSLDTYNDLATDLGEEYVPSTSPITNPEYWPATNTTPQLDPSLFPNYQPSTNPDSGETPDNPSQGGSGDMEIDLDGLLSLFNILFFLIMIIVMLIYLFLSCLAFIVMIFRIPASSNMLPDEMVMGFEHLKTIMIPGMNISIYGFAMALIYMFIIFAVIKLIRLEINDFKFPRSYK